MINVAILSFWHVHGKDYAEETINHPDTRVAAVWDEDEARGRAEATALNVPFVADLEEILRDPGIHAVVVTTPTRAHREVIIRAAQAGKHIFAEKAIAATVREAEEILAAVRQAGVTFVVAMFRYYEPYVSTIKATLDSGVLGQITQFRIRDGHPFCLPSAGHPTGRIPEHFYDPYDAQGGAVIDLCHPVYLMAHFMGLPESVSATFGFVTGRQVEDNAVVTLRYPKGAIGIFETGFTTASTPFIIEAHGTEGSLIFSKPGIGESAAAFAGGQPLAPGATGGPDGQIHIRTNANPSWTIQPVPYEAPRSGNAHAYTQWVAHIHAGSQADENNSLGMQLTALIEASYASANTGKAVAVAHD